MDNSFKSGVLTHASRARRILLRTASVLEALNTIRCSKPRMAQCQQANRLIFLPYDLGGGAWQLRADDSGRITPIDVGACVPSDKTVGHWNLLMIEVNWDYHVASVRHMWKDNGQTESCITDLVKAVNAISILNKCQRDVPSMRPPTPSAYPVELAANAKRVSHVDEPIVLWLQPVWRQ